MPLSTWDSRAVQWISQHANVHIRPAVSAPCHSDVIAGWSGVCAVDDTDLWLANGAGARRAPLDMIDLLDFGPEPQSAFSFAFKGSRQTFSVQPLSNYGAVLFRSHLLHIFGGSAIRITG